MTHWLKRGADGWRLDAAYAVPDRFWSAVLPRVREQFGDAWFVGEVIHGDYTARVRESGFDSVTQYELWKAIWSSLNDGNFHELDWALVRHNEFLDDFVPMTFVGNHDVTRIASQLANTRHLEHALVILFTTGGTPSVYAGDESAYRGVKEERFGGDDAVRPEFTAPLMGVDEHGHDIFRLHQYLIGLRRRHAWLHAARTSPRGLTNTQYVYQTRNGDDALLVALNIDDAPMPLSLPELGLGQGQIVAGSGAPPQSVVGEAEIEPHGWLIIARPLSRSTRGRVLLAAVELVQHPAEIGVVVGCVREQRHRRAQLHVVGPAEDLVDRAAVDRRDQPRAFPQPRAEHVVRQICPRLVQRRNPIVLRSRDCGPGPAAAEIRTRSSGCASVRCVVR